MHALRDGRSCMIVTWTTLNSLYATAKRSSSSVERKSARRALLILVNSLSRGRIVVVPFSEELSVRDDLMYYDEDIIFWSTVSRLSEIHPLLRLVTLSAKAEEVNYPYIYLKPSSHLLRGFRRENVILERKFEGEWSSRTIGTSETKSLTQRGRMLTSVRDAPSKIYKYNAKVALLHYRRDRPLFDKYHVNARNIAPGRSRGAVEHDFRGLGVYTPTFGQPDGG